MSLDIDDRIVYVVHTRPGGVDGRDHTDKGGPRFASFDHAEAEARATAWDEVRAQVVNVQVEKARAINGLSPMARLLLGLNPEKRKKIVGRKIAR